MSTALALRDEELNETEIALIKDSIAKGSTDSELKLFIRQCNRTRLDPFAGQIHCIARYDSKLKRDVRTAQVSIDGMRLVAERTDRYAGQTEALYCGPDGQWTDVWLDKTTPPLAAKIGVYRLGFVEALWATATWDQFAVYNRRRIGKSEPARYELKLGPMWEKMPAHMLAKCAEALALRKAFPMELSGLYIPEEMDDTPPPPAAKRRAKRASDDEKEPTVKRRAPGGETEQTETQGVSTVATGDRVDELKRMLALVTEEEDKGRLNDLWKDAKLIRVSALNDEQVEVAIALVGEVLNYVEPEPRADSDGVEVDDGDPDDDDDDDTSDDEEEDTSPPASAKQIGLINAKMEELGIDERRDVHAKATDVLGVTVTSLKKLTIRQASKLIDYLIDATH